MGGIYEIRRWDGSDDMIYIPSLLKTRSAIQKLMGGGGGGIHRHTESFVIAQACCIFFFQNKENRLKRLQITFRNCLPILPGSCSFEVSRGVLRCSSGSCCGAVFPLGSHEEVIAEISCPVYQMALLWICDSYIPVPAWSPGHYLASTEIYRLMQTIWWQVIPIYKITSPEIRSRLYCGIIGVIQFSICCPSVPYTRNQSLNMQI
jgi:hypothetical protein